MTEDDDSGRPIEEKGQGPESEQQEPATSVTGDSKVGEGGDCDDGDDYMVGEMVEELVAAGESEKVEDAEMGGSELCGELDGESGVVREAEQSELEGTSVASETVVVGEDTGEKADEFDAGKIEVDDVGSVGAKIECEEEDVGAERTTIESLRECNVDILHADIKVEEVKGEEDDCIFEDVGKNKGDSSGKDLVMEQSENLTACDISEKIDEFEEDVKEEDGEDKDAEKSLPDQPQVSAEEEGDGDKGDERKEEISVSGSELVMGEQATSLPDQPPFKAESEQFGVVENLCVDEVTEKRLEDVVDYVVIDQSGSGVHSKQQDEPGSVSPKEILNLGSTVEGKVEDNSSGPSDSGHQEHAQKVEDLDHTTAPDILEECGAEDEEMGEEKVKDEPLAAPKVDVTTGGNVQNLDDLDHNAASDIFSKEYGDDDVRIGEEKVEDHPVAVPEANVSLQNIEMELTAGDDEINEENLEEEEPSAANTEVAIQLNTPEAEHASGKQKRGRPRVASRKSTEEDLCFICFDGGDLVVCDRRGCPKVYHPSCVNRDEEFFQSKGRWICGWHQCSKCEKNAQYMCLTCTFSLCKGCIKDTVIYSIRGNKGFCETCLKTVKMIESIEQGNNEAQLNFDDKNSWESLFKDYWLDLKEKLQLTSEELAQAKNPWKGSDVVSAKPETADETFNVDNYEDSGSNKPSGNVIAHAPKRKKIKKQKKSAANDAHSPSGSDTSDNETGNKSKRRKVKKQTKSPRKAGASGAGRGSQWASNELLKFVMHMKNGDTSVLSQFDVQELLLKYIRNNKLRDPRRKSQIICDTMLKGLFRKQHVGHFEMLKLLESHFLIREEDQSDDIHRSSVDNESSPLDIAAKADASAKIGKDKKRKIRRKGFGRGVQANTDEYAAIDIHNITLVFLRRNLMEILLEDVEKFHDKVVGAFVRIRITGSNQIQDMYRLVQIVGTVEAPTPYKVGKRTTDINLEILNLNKKEVVSIDIISNQEFTEDECKRLRQSIRCGLINRLTVGDILEKAMDLQAARVSDWLETEMVRLSHLCDRASDMGRRKELRVNAEKLQNLKKPEERERRLEEIPEIHADPKMDPSYESEEDEEEADDRKQENFLRPRGSSFNRQGLDSPSPRKGSSASNDSWSGSKSTQGLGRELGRSFSSKGEDTIFSGEPNRDSLGQKRSREPEPLDSWDRHKVSSSSQTGNVNSYSSIASELVSGEAAPSLSSQSIATINESEKMWHYKDPSGKVHGPFSIVQLRKWNSTGYFPKNLTIWRNDEVEDDGILLLDALAGKYQKESKLLDNQSIKSQHMQIGQLSVPHSVRPATNGSVVNGLSSSVRSVGDNWASPSQLSLVNQASLSVDVLKGSAGGKISDYDHKNESINLPSPTPSQFSMNSAGQAFANRVSPIPPSAANVSLSSYVQSNSSSAYQLQQTDKATASVKPGGDFRNSLAVVPSMVQQSVPQDSYNQWGNATTLSTDNFSSDLQNQSFSSMPSSNTWRPTPASNQVDVQPQAKQNQSWRPVQGNQNMGWALQGMVRANTNVNWTPTGQVASQANPSWAVQGMVPAIGNATGGWEATPGSTTQSWVPSGNGTSGYVVSGNSQTANMNSGWTGQAAGNTNQVWAATGGQGSMPSNANNNQALWGNDQNGNDRSFGGRQWSNRQQGSMGAEGGSSYHQRGGGGGGGGSGATRVCDYYLSGRCKKGSACNWLHPPRQ